MEEKMKKYRLFVIILALVVMISACTPAGAEPTPQPPAAPPEEPMPVPGEGERGQNAYVDEIDVMLLESFPVQVNVRVQGNLPDGCTYLDEIEEQREGNTITVTIWTVRDPEAMCTMALVPFEEVISLDAEGLPAGEYTVVVQDQTDTFRLDVDNVAQE
jgi:inhibitor of cysteine peptidase